MNAQKPINTLWVVLGAFVILILVGVFTYIHYSNRANTEAEDIRATYLNNQNILGQITLTILEVSKVAKLYAKDLKELVTASMSGRYGSEGSQAMFQWIQEQNPNLDSTVYIKIQQVIESGRKEFQLNQTVSLDKCRSFNTNTTMVWSGFWYKLAGFTKDTLKEECTPVISEQAREAFETKIDKGTDI